MSSLSDRFIDALRALEADHNVEPMIALYGNDCELGNVVVPHKFHGAEGAREFWTKYRETFDSVRSDFRNEIGGDDRVALEWTSEASSADGKQLHYSGVSILEVEGGKIKRFHAYFDPALLGRQMESVASA